MLLFTVPAAAPPGDTTPNVWSWDEAIDLNVPLSTTRQSSIETLTGFDTATPITITGGEYSINGGAFTSAAGTFPVGGTLRVQGLSSGSYNTDVVVTPTVGGVSVPFTIRTMAVPPTYTAKGAWMDVLPFMVFDSGYNTMAGSTIRNKLLAGSLLSGGSKIRIKIGTTPAGTINPKFTIGRHSAAEGQDYDFASSPAKVAMTFRGVAVASQDVQDMREWSDEKAFALDNTFDHLIAGYASSANFWPIYKNGEGGSGTAWSKAGDDQATDDVEGYSSMGGSFGGTNTRHNIEWMQAWDAAATGPALPTLPTYPASSGKLSNTILDKFGGAFSLSVEAAISPLWAEWQSRRLTHRANNKLYDNPWGGAHYEWPAGEIIQTLRGGAADSQADAYAYINDYNNDYFPPNPNEPWMPGMGGGVAVANGAPNSAAYSTAYTKSGGYFDLAENWRQYGPGDALSSLGNYNYFSNRVMFKRFGIHFSAEMGGIGTSGTNIARMQEMVDWFIDRQFSDGGFPAGNDTTVTPVGVTQIYQYGIIVWDMMLHHINYSYRRTELLAAIKKACIFAWRNRWRASRTIVYNYANRQGGWTAASWEGWAEGSDLSPCWMTAFAWLAWQDQDRQWEDRVYLTMRAVLDYAYLTTSGVSDSSQKNWEYAWTLGQANVSYFLAKAHEAAQNGAIKFKSLPEIAGRPIGGATCIGVLGNTHLNGVNTEPDSWTHQWYRIKVAWGPGNDGGVIIIPGATSLNYSVPDTIYDGQLLMREDIPIIGGVQGLPEYTRWTQPIA